METIPVIPITCKNLSIVVCYQQLRNTFFQLHSRSMTLSKAMTTTRSALTVGLPVSGIRFHGSYWTLLDISTHFIKFTH